MELATLIEISILEFWEITPFELNVAAKSYAKRKGTENKDMIYQAYLISRWVWAKKIDIEKVLGDKKEKRIMTDEDMLKQVEMLNKVFGGAVNTCNS